MSTPRKAGAKDAKSLSGQTQFLNVVSRDEATAKFREHLRLAPLGPELVPLEDALGRVLAQDVVAAIDVPGFDRANVDGFAMRAQDTFGAMEETPRTLQLNDEVLAPGIVPSLAVTPGHATPIATGGMLPRGADAVLMVEHSELAGSADGRLVEVRRPLTGGENVSYAGTDIARGETVLRAGQRLTSREIGVLAALGRSACTVFRRPRVAIFSTGNEIVAPGESLRPGAVYDSNAATIGAAVEELGGLAMHLGVIADDEQALAAALTRGLESTSSCFRRNIEGRRGYLVPDRSRAAQPRCRRPRRRAEARQADLPRSHRGQARRHTARVSHLRHLHFPRVRRAGDPRVCRPAA
jgi:putative molybdopterin biosynthesis protein